MTHTPLQLPDGRHAFLLMADLPALGLCSETIVILDGDRPARVFTAIEGGREVQEQLLGAVADGTLRALDPDLETQVLAQLSSVDGLAETIPPWPLARHGHLKLVK